MSMLEQIVNHKKNEVAQRKALYPTKLLEGSIYFETTCVSMRHYLKRKDKSGVIAEIKRKSPSSSSPERRINVEQLGLGYMQAGASALSVLTDELFFGGSNEDLMIARTHNFCPILRKDFIIDEYQVVETKSIGADCCLLIADCLSPKKCAGLASFSKSLGLEVLLEVHNRNQIESHVNSHIDLVGVNNRNLHDFSISIDNSLQLAPLIPPEFTKISESGIKEAAQILELKNCGFSGFLIGTYFLEHPQPDLACKKLVQQLKIEKDETENMRDEIS